MTTIWTPEYTTLAIAALALLLFAIVLLVILWSVKRNPDPHLEVECDEPLERLVPTLAGLSHAQVTHGNAIELLENGAFFDAMIGEVSRAGRSVHFETFLWKEGRLGARLADALAERARAGVAVRVLLDAQGTRKMGRDAERRLVEAGCKLAKYHPWRLRNLGLVNQRDHRKVVVVDGRVAFVGGHCIVDSWLGEAQDREHYRDISVRLEGPAVHDVQSTFSENWVKETGELFAGEAYFPELAPVGGLTVHAARIKPRGGAPAVKILHHLVICAAKQRIRIQNPYFVPDPEAMRALGRAAARGVDVRVMVPSAEASDMPLVQHAAHRNFARLLGLGVRIFEYPRTLLHQKVMVVDGVWSAVGTTNFDDRALEINDEITLGIADPGLAAQLEAIFDRDAAECVEIEREAWLERPLWHRAMDHGLYLFNEHL